MALESNAHQRKAGGDWDVHTLGSLRAAVTAALRAKRQSMADKADRDKDLDPDYIRDQIHQLTLLLELRLDSAHTVRIHDPNYTVSRTPASNTTI